MFDFTHAHQLNRIECKLDFLIKRLIDPAQQAELTKLVAEQKAKADALKDAIQKQQES